MRYRLISVIWMTLISSHFLVQAQSSSQDPVLFSVGNGKVHLSEFKYVYEKSNGSDADYTPESVNEFLDLYKKFKLKVEDARDQGMEEDPELQSELNMYREQLATKYMSDHAVLGNLTKELYERMQWEVDVSHILRRLPTQSSEAMVEKTLEDIISAKKALDSGIDFGIVAKKYSQDRSVTENEGHLGYRRAKLPEGFYDLETAIYNTPVGKISEPVQSNLGYHVIKVNDKRPAHGNLEIAHILVRVPRMGVKDTSQQEIQRIYMKLQEGLDFATLAEKYSQDKNTHDQGGYLGFFKAGTYAPEFEETAYAIEKDGGFSRPVKTEFGWHIIQRISQEEWGTYEEEKHYLENLIRQDPRYEIAESALVEKIKQEEDFQMYDVKVTDLLDLLGEDVYRFQWEAPEDIENPPLFRLRDEEYHLSDFIAFLNENRDIRYRRTSDHEPISAMEELLQKFIDDEVFKFEKTHLEEKHPEFRAIMREYREGIMLFEISRDKIWERAGQDSAGLHEYYEAHRSDYHEPRKLELDNFVVNSISPVVLEKVRKRLKKKSPEKVLKKFNKAAQVVKYQEETMMEEEWMEQFAAKDEDVVEGHTIQVTDQDGGVTRISKIRKVHPGAPLDFEDARGAVMSDYQEYLEKQWVSELRKKYDIEVDEGVLQSIVRS